MTSKALIVTLACGLPLMMALAFGGQVIAQPTFDLAGATIVVRRGPLPKAEETASKVLIEELEKRTGKRLRVSTDWPARGPVVALSSSSSDAPGGHAVPRREWG